MKVIDSYKLDGKVALVTGGGRGLGLQFAQALGEAGARVVLLARSADELETASRSLQAQGIDVAWRVADMTALDGLPALVASLRHDHGEIDILVNNAGRAEGGPAEGCTDEVWHSVMRLNVDAAFVLTREVARQSMLPRGRGKVINIASVGGLFGNPMSMQTVAYNASKGAVLSLTRALASEWGPRGLQVNAICPGFFDTRMAAPALQYFGPAAVAQTPLGRLGGDTDLKGLVVFFASAASDFITGQHLVVDGGASTTYVSDPMIGRERAQGH
ncbi:MAG: SDR family oxidoreductase [Sphaerotilus natans subsp. sulfidivorans]|uniref:SDR family oxidoreductase n=1 Tax=Sphaerotilus sulfidivorans TaxID=639200 RepID=UPI002353B8FE|nr:SDR family oxidoreductase [Sphaerotilus sulfidivorans]MCK6401327.1 SDR family oxidoreductase [Sphaerotilus sulfidivorans]